MRMAGPLVPHLGQPPYARPLARSIRWKPSSSASTSRPLRASAIEPTSLGVRHSLYRPSDMRRTSLALESTQYSDWSRASHSGHSPSLSRVSPMISCRTLDGVRHPALVVLHFLTKSQPPSDSGRNTFSAGMAAPTV